MIVAPNTEPAATIVIPTRNRRQTLLQVVRAALAQSVPVEVIVCDDASTDGTGDVLRSEFPHIRYVCSETNLGPTHQRNVGASMARSPYLVTLDDDCILTSPRTVEQTLACFDNSRVGAVTIPFINVLHPQKPMLQQPSDLPEQLKVTFEYYGGMIIFRRDVYQAAGGYHSFLFMHVEESDLSIRILNTGHFIRLGNADPISHLESPVRDSHRLDRLGPRNQILYAWYNVPLQYLPVHVSGTTLKYLRHGWNRGTLLTVIKGLFTGYRDVWSQWKFRRPVDLDVYRLSRELKRQPEIYLPDIEERLPNPFLGETQTPDRRT